MTICVADYTSVPQPFALLGRKGRIRWNITRILYAAIQTCTINSGTLCMASNAACIGG